MCLFFFFFFLMWLVLVYGCFVLSLFLCDLTTDNERMAGVTFGCSVAKTFFTCHGRR
jgi:hypothetical protein